jgi:ATP-dependent exoDNAse (exonuclease V) alpha subunit
MLIYREMVNYIIKTNKHFLIHGFAGSGKSYLINELSGKLRCIKLAPTGLTALNIDGMTVDRLITLYSKSKTGVIEYIERASDCVIIDEVSMIQYYKIEIILSIFKELERRNSGTRLIIIGDPFQLPPVVTGDMISAYSQKEGYPLSPNDFYFFKSKLFREYFDSDKFACLFLSGNKRQSDPIFGKALENIATGLCDDSLFEYLNQRVNVNNDLSTLRTPVVTPCKNAVSFFNRNCFEQTNQNPLVNSPFVETAGISYEELIKEYSDILEPVYYGIETPVVFIQNDKINRWKNGTRGQIKYIQAGCGGYEYIHVLSNDNTVIYVEPVWFNITELRYNPRSKQVNPEIIARIFRLPFILSYALTVHKVQGMTLDQLTFNIWSGTFASGQLYVALSRVKTLEGLCLETPLRKEHVIVSPEVKEYFDTFKCKCLDVV